MKKCVLAVVTALVLLAPFQGVLVRAQEADPGPEQAATAQESYHPGDVPAQTGAAEAMTPAIHGTMPAEGTWNLATGVITPATAGTPHTSLTPYVEDNGDGTLTCYALVMPGTAFNYGDKFFSLTDAGGTTYSYYLNISGGFTAGASTYCDIDLTVHRTGIELSGFGISSWTPNEDATGSGNVSMD